MRKRICLGKRVMAVILAAMTLVLAVPETGLTSKASENMFEEIYVTDFGEEPETEPFEGLDEEAQEDLETESDSEIDNEADTELQIDSELEADAESDAESEINSKIDSDEDLDTTINLLEDGNDEMDFLEAGDTYTCGDYTYRLVGEEATITGYAGKEAELVIPERLDGHLVTAIGPSAFRYNRDITGVVIPDSVTSIGNNAFYSCSKITDVKLPNGLTSIEKWTFASCDRLDNVVIPDTVTVIEEAAFKYCDGLKTVHLPLGLETVGKSAFSECESLESIVVPANVKTIAAAAFGFCDKLTSIELPEGLETIEHSAFYYDKVLEKVTIPSTVKKMGGGIFYESAKIVEFAPGMTKVPDFACNQATELTEVVLPTGLTAIGKSAFAECKVLEKVVVPDGVTTIGEKAFEKDEALTVTVPKSIENVGNKAFFGCHVEQPCGDNARWRFDTVHSFAEILGSGEVGNAKDNIFGVFAPEVKFLEIGGGITAISEHAFENTRNLMGVTMGDEVTAIKANAFSGCASLSRIELSKALLNIEDDAFAGCEALDSIVFDGDAPSVTGAAFPSHKMSGFLPLGNSTYDTAWKVQLPYIQWENYDNTLPVHDVIILLDSSDGMQGYNRLGYMKGTAKYFCEILGGKLNNIRVSVIDSTGFDTLLVANSTDVVRQGYAIDNIEIRNVAFSGEYYHGLIDAEELALASDAQKKSLILFSSGDLGAYSEKVENDFYEAGAYFRSIGCDTYSVAVAPDKDGALMLANFAGSLDRFSFFNEIDEFAAKFVKPVQDNSEAIEFKAAFAGVAADPYDGLYYNAEKDRYEVVYTGSDIKPELVVSGAASNLKEGVDYTVKYSGNRNVSVKNGKATVTITGKGNYAGTKVLEFYVLPADLGVAAEKGLISGTDAIKLKNGEKLAPKIWYRGNLLKATDMVLSSSGPVKEDCSITIAGKGNFTGKLENVQVKVMPAAEAKNLSINVKLKAGKHVYNGENQTLTCSTGTSKGELEVTAEGGKKLLTENEDYTVTYSSNVNVGTATVIVRGMGNYHGAVTKTFKIAADTTSKIDAVIDEAPLYYSPEGVVPEVSVTVDRDRAKEQLIKGRDYTLTCSGNKKAGNAKCTVSFIGNYKGHAAIKNIPFTIKPASFDDAKVIVPDMAYKNPGSYLSTPMVAIDGVLLDKKDYEVHYYYETEEITKKDKLYMDWREGDYMVTIVVKVVGKGNYDDDVAYGEYSVIWHKACYNISGCKVVAKAKNAKGKDVAIGQQEYCGKEIKPAVGLVTGGARVPSYWYEVYYFNNVKKGKATVVVLGNGMDSVGYTKTTFTIGSKKFR